MTTSKEAMAKKLQALNTLLENPRPHDDTWSINLLGALESIYELALTPGTPVVAASRGEMALAA